MSTLQPAHRAVVALLVAVPAAAQTVHVVGPGGFAKITQAIAAAANGDVVRIQSGTYAPFTLAKDLTLTAAPGATVVMHDLVTWGGPPPVAAPRHCPGSARPAAALPQLAEPAWLAGAIAVAAAGVTDAAGTLVLTFAVPPTPALQHQAFFVQAVAVATVPLAPGPPVGGAVR